IESSFILSRTFEQTRTGVSYDEAALLVSHFIVAGPYEELDDLESASPNISHNISDEIDPELRAQQFKAYISKTSSMRYNDALSRTVEDVSSNATVGYAGDDIKTLVTSVLYQRHVWGIHIPVIGIEICKKNTAARIVFGWLGNANLNGHDCLPVVHLAYCPSDVPNPKLGVFDLTDPVSVLHLAQFILSLECHFEDVLQGAKSPEIQPLAWRADHIESDLLSREQWNSIKPATLLSWVSDSMLVDREESFKPQTPPLNEKNHNVEFLIGDAPINQRTPSTASFLTERYVGCLPRFQHSEIFGVSIDPEVFLEINGFLAIYDALTKPFWPSHWKSLDDLPRPKGHVSQVFELLLSQHIAEDAATYIIGDSDDIATSDCLSEELSSLMDMSVTAQYLILSSAGCKIKARSLFDTLLYRYLFFDKTQDYLDVLIERNLNYPKNRAFEHIVNGEEKLAEIRTWQHTSRMTYFTDVDVLPNYPMDERRALYAKASTQLHQYTSAMQLRFHGVFEPSVGVSESIVVVSFENPPGMETNHLVGMINDTALIRVPEPLFSTTQASTNVLDIPCFDNQSCRQPGIISSKNPDSRYSEGDLRFPIALIQHAESETEADAAMNWLRMNSVAAVSFMFALGISGQPVYGILTCGTVASVICTWYSVQSDQHIYMFDNDRISRYDISRPLDCLNFAAFILRLRREAEKLKDVIVQGGYVEKFFGQSEDGPLRNWTVEALSKRFKGENNPSDV
ncbi:hypothetical protein H0H81_012063, partial [Sphagnurus paluster]